MPPVIYLFTGNGKGKTSAALGVAFRALGHGLRVCMIQFMKGTRASGEHETVKRFAPDMEIIRGDTGFYKILDDRFTDDEHTKMAARLLGIAREKTHAGTWQLIILDELNVALSLGLLPLPPVMDLLRDLPQSVHVIVTGRNAPQELQDLADLVSDIQEIKHPFQKGRAAQKGLDM